MKCEIIYKRGKPYIRVDFRPSKRIRQAKKRIQKRQQELARHFGYPFGYEKKAKT